MDEIFRGCPSPSDMESALSIVWITKSRPMYTVCWLERMSNQTLSCHYHSILLLSQVKDYVASLFFFFLLPLLVPNPESLAQKCSQDMSGWECFTSRLGKYAKMLEIMKWCPIKGKNTQFIFIFLFSKDEFVDYLQGLRLIRM